MVDHRIEDADWADADAHLHDPPDILFPPPVWERAAISGDDARRVRRLDDPVG